MCCRAVSTSSGQLSKISDEQNTRLGKVYSEEMTFGKTHPGLETIVKDLGERNVGKE